MEQHAERQRQHAEEDLHVAHAQQPHGNRHDDARDDGREHRQLEALEAEAARHHRDRIRTQSHEQRVAERQQPGIAEQQVEAEQDDAVRQRWQHQRHVERRQQVRRRDEQQQRARDRELAARHSSGLPKRPVGRKISTAITIR